MISWSNKEEAAAIAEEILKPVPHAEFARRVSDKRFTFYLSVASRLGAAALASLVEYRLFHPCAGPASNDDFLYMIVNFDDVPFTIFGVPASYEGQVKELADAIHMSVRDAMLVMIGPNGVMKFPGWSEATTGRYNLYSIENSSGSQVYLNRPDLNTQIRKREMEIVDSLMKYGSQIPVELIRDHLWGLEASTQQ